MKIAVVTDLHMISPQERLANIRESRIFFGDAWPSFKQLNARLKQEAPDLVVCLGDMVDWYSDENRDFSLTLLGELPCPWVAVPGNHDFAAYEEEENGIRHISAEDGYAASLQGWTQRGIELHNRYVDAGDTGLILLDSAISGVPVGTKEWLEEIKGRHSRQLLFTHVPLDHPATREYILSVEPHRDMNKYVQSKSPWVYPAIVPGTVSHIFTGHLHFAGDLQVDGMRMHMLSMSISDKRFSDRPASACIIEIGRTLDVRRISL